MKRITFITTLTLIAFCQCNDKENYYATINNAPIINIYSGDEEIEGEFIRDSIKIGGNKKTYRVEYSDEEELTLSIYENGILYENYDDVYYRLHTEERGEKRIEFYLRDSYKRVTKRTIILTSFENLTPVARLKITVLNDGEVEVDITDSYDRDAKFGGRLTKYEYIMNGEVINSNLNKIRYKFFVTGTKRIQARVMDNNNAWSSYVEEYITLAF